VRAVSQDRAHACALLAVDMTPNNKQAVADEILRQNLGHERSKLLQPKTSATDRLQPTPAPTPSKQPCYASSATKAEFI